MNHKVWQLQCETPSITVLMSVFNGARWLGEAIESVLKQTFRDFEFIIVNDGSTDDSAAIIARYQIQDSRIIVISKSNTGLSESLNCGIQKAQGEWIARLDADDICESTRFAKQITVARSSSKLVFIGTGLTIINEAGEKLATHKYPTQNAQLLRNLISARKFPAHSSALYRTKVVRSLGGYRTRFKRAEDRDLWLRLSERGEITCLSEPLIQLRHHSGQISHDEAGKRQLLDSRIGSICYWLRREGISDPVDSDEVTFQTFVMWLHERYIADGFFEFHAHWALIRSLVRAKPISIALIKELTDYCVRNPRLALRIMKERISGDTLARRLASEWAKAELNCSLSN